MQAEGYQIDFENWHEYVHGRIDYSLIDADPALRETLCSIELPRFVFTNADRHHADKCLERLGIADLFQVRLAQSTLYEVACGP
jgi:FMN phosphatase YigB (HAD superfamily)